VWTGAQALPLGLVDKIGGLREALEEARKLGNLPVDAPFTETPEEDDSLLGVVLKLVGITSIGMNGAAAMALPPAFLGIARSLSPFLVFESQKALARSEYVDSEPADDRAP
jgi:protease-4